MIVKNRVRFRFIKNFLEWMRLALQRVDDLENFFEGPNWVVSINDKKEGVIIHQKTGETGLTCLKAEGILQYRAEDIFKVIGNDDYRADFDAVMDKSYLLEKAGCQTYFIY